MEYITAQDLYQRIEEALATEAQGVANHILHDTLVLCCHEGLRHTRHAFGNLSSQVDYLCRDRHMAAQDVLAIQRMRRHSNSDEPLSPEDLGYDCRALALFVSAVFQTSVPASLVGRIPATGRVTKGSPISSYTYLRCVVRSFDDETIHATVVNQDCDEEVVTIDYRHTPDYIDFSYLTRILQEGMTLNLLDCHREDERLIPGLIIVEPDYLLDISAIASCFEDYGHHPLLFTLHRLKERQNSKHILLGNFAGSALDDLINHAQYRFADTLQRNFREKAIEYACCPDFDPSEFKKLAESQVSNMQAVVAELFGRYNKEKAILEPSFICEKLGIQGRVDLMTTDLRLLVEQKSGQNYFLKRHTRNRYGSLHVEKHYVQVLLYFGVLSYNFGLSPKHADIYLLYSKYPLPDGLMQVEPLRKLLREALKYRNQVVALEYWMAFHGLERILPHLHVSTLNTEHLDDYFFHAYLQPQIETVTTPLQTMKPLERAYFCRMMRFVMREQIVAKVGSQEGVGSAGADLWNMPLSMKRETGNIFTRLRIVDKKSDGTGGYDTLTLLIPKQEDDFLPNFRRGDMVYLYAYDQDKAPDVRRSILHKGTLQEITPTQLVVHLNDGQQNPHILQVDDDKRWYCLEHAGSDIGSTSAMGGLYTFITAPEARRDVLLAKRPPMADKTLRLSQSYNKNYDEIVEKAKQAQDYFLLIGPPGTGKTSMALQYLVRELILLPTPERPTGGNGLLLSYTHRAVDEICGMLVDNDIDFIRLGSAYSCDPRYQSHLLSERLTARPTLSAIKAIIDQTSLVVATTSTLAARPFLFQVKHFDVAIVDEASQILEPNLMGILGAHCNGRCCIDKFVLIGDHKQLPAVVQQDAAESVVEEPILQEIQLTDCRHSLFERLINTERAAKRTDFIGILRRQGRMHPEIADFPNRRFYERENLLCVPLPHQLEDTIYPSVPSSAQQTLSPLGRLLMENRRLFFPSKNRRQAGVSEKVNTEEARIVAQLLKTIHTLSGTSFDPSKTVGVIVPYRNQIAMIRQEINRLDIPSLIPISIDTVERYQGSQRDIIIYSFTVQNRYQLDFLTSNCFVEDGKVIDRKLNVALTRARKQLIITGNEAILRQNALFKDLIDDMPHHEI